MVVFNRWLAMVAGMFVMMVSGNIYLFPDYSNNLRSILGYNVEQVNLVGTLLNTGMMMMMMMTSDDVINYCWITMF